MQVQVNGWTGPTTVSGNGPGLLLIHGWNASRRFWDQILPCLSRRFRVVAPDLIGFGDASKPSRNFDLKDLMDWTLHVADATGLERFTLLGHSMGAAIGIMTAERHPDRVERLVLSNGLVHGPSALFRFHRWLTAFPFRQMAFMLRPVRSIRRILSDDFSEIESLNPAAARDLLRGTYRILGSTLDATLHADLEPALRGLPHPVGILWSEEDTQLARSQFEIQRRARPAAPLEILRPGGHCPMIERPEAYLSALDRLLERLERSPL